MLNKASGVAFVVSAPSGAGKSSLIRKLIQEFPDLVFSVSYTTRLSRPGEKEGREYHFVDKQSFLQLIEQGFFAEWAKVHSNYYGTPLQENLDMLDSGYDVLFDIDVQGARRLKDSLTQGRFVFILPPSRSELKHRLYNRGSDDEQTIEKRLYTAKEELLAANEFDFWVLNDDLNKAYEILRSIYLSEKAKPEFNQQLLSNILNSW